MRRKRPASNFKTQLLLTAAAAAASAAPALAEAPKISVEQAPNALPRTDFGNTPSLSPEAPVLLEANQVDYQHENGLVIASGQVAVTQGDTILLADQLAYDQEGDLVIAKGNVSLLDASGNVYFADEVELTGDLKTGALKQFKARFNDNSLFAAARARKLDENKTELFKSVYSPCKCTDDETREPIRPQWSIRSERTLIDQQAQLVTHDNVFFNIYDLPVFYSPYLSHATPGADNKSGLLLPEYQHTNNIGSVVKVPVYYAIAPDKDLTITPINTSQEGLVMAGEYRQEFNSGQMRFDGSITHPSDRDAAGDVTSGHQFRGHINAIGEMKIDPDSLASFNIHRTTDDTYLRRYNFSQDTLLESKASLERFRLWDNSDRSYGAITGLAFQGLTAQDDKARTPLVLPLAVFAYESDPLAWRSRYFLTGNLMSLTRDVGSRSRRFSTTAGWRLPFITDDGQIIEVSTQLRGDAYDVEDQLLSNGESFNGTTGRLVPQVSALWRYPFINRWRQGSLMLEPVAMMALSPKGGNPEKIPNEDSGVPEFTDTNLFDPNRFAGYDRIEVGPRLAYGLRGQLQAFGDGYLNWLLGQNYRLENDRAFPYSNDLTDHFSDYVGKVGVTAGPAALAYRFRLDRDGLSSKRNEVEATYGQYPLGASLSYLSLKNDPILATKEAATAAANINLTREWTWNISASKDLLLNQVTATSMGLTFQNECTSVSGVMSREYTRDRDLEPSTSFLFRISFKNLE